MPWTPDIQEDIFQADLAFLESSFSSDELNVSTSGSWTDITVTCSQEPPRVQLLVKLGLNANGTRRLESMSCSASTHSLSRDDQAKLNKLCATFLDGLDEEEAPIYSVALRMTEWLAEHPLSTTITDPGTPQADLSVAAPTTTLKIKRVLLWSHHLLAISKRKDIVKWSTELWLAGISKPGYPGIIVVEGLADSVDEFVARIKRLQWQALQVRCEEEETIILNRSDGVTSALQAMRLHEPDSKCHVTEVESLADVSHKMQQAGLEDMFKSAMKLP